MSAWLVLVACLGGVLMLGISHTDDGEIQRVSGWREQTVSVLRATMARELAMLKQNGWPTWPLALKQANEEPSAAGTDELRAA
jgi:hypothetical protein